MPRQGLSFWGIQGRVIFIGLRKSLFRKGLEASVPETEVVISF